MLLLVTKTRRLPVGLEGGWCQWGCVLEGGPPVGFCWSVMGRHEGAFGRGSRGILEVTVPSSPFIPLPSSGSRSTDAGCNVQAPGTAEIMDDSPRLLFPPILPGSARCWKWGRGEDASFKLRDSEDIPLLLSISSVSLAPSNR